MQRHRHASDDQSAARWPFGLATAALAVGLALMAACATRDAAEPASDETPGSEAASPTPSPTPSPEPAQPQPMYRVTVSTEGGETEQTLIVPDGESAPDAAGEAEPPPTPDATPQPTPKPANFLSRAWQKVFPPKAALRPKATPDVFQLKTPREGIFSRMWHSIFPRKEHPPAALPPQWIGTIKLVNEQAGYALIDTQGFMPPPTGDTIRAVGNDTETGSLKISADRNPPFFIADIVSGKPRPGDRVYSPLAP